MATQRPNLEPFDNKKTKRPNLEPFDLESCTRAQTSNPLQGAVGYAGSGGARPNFEPFNSYRGQWVMRGRGGRAQTSNPSTIKRTQATEPRTLRRGIEHARSNLEPFDFKKSPGDKTSNPSILNRAHAPKLRTLRFQKVTRRPNLEPFDFETKTRAQTLNPSAPKTAQATKPRTLRP